MKREEEKGLKIIGVKAEIELSQTLTGKIINSQRSTVVCTYRPMLESIFPDICEDRGYIGSIFTYHCKECDSPSCKNRQKISS